MAKMEMPWPPGPAIMPTGMWKVQRCKSLRWSNWLQLRTDHCMYVDPCHLSVSIGRENPCSAGYSLARLGKGLTSVGDFPRALARTECS